MNHTVPWAVAALGTGHGGIYLQSFLFHFSKVLALKCECGEIHYPDFPSGLVKEAQYGPNIKSLVVYLKQYGFISYDRMAELFSDIFNISIRQ